MTCSSVAVFACALALVACGSDDTSSFEAGSGTGGSASTASANGGTSTTASSMTTSSSGASSSTTTSAGGAGPGGAGTGATAAGGAGTGGVGQGGGTGGGSAGGPACLDCSQVLQGGAAMQACTMNGPPSSAELWGALEQCVCTTNCTSQCSEACMGGSVTGACQNCVGQSCFAQFQACQSDTGMMTCSTCSSVLFGSGDPNNLCPGSVMAFQDLEQCTCIDSCSASCGANVCAGLSPSAACQQCVSASCGPEFQTCIQN